MAIKGTRRKMPTILTMNVSTCGKKHKKNALTNWENIKLIDLRLHSKPITKHIATKQNTMELQAFDTENATLNRAMRRQLKSIAWGVRWYILKPGMTGYIAIKMQWGIITFVLWLILLNILSRQ